VPHTALPADHADRALVVRMLAGEEAAFRSLVGALHPLLLRLASTIVRSVGVAEEVVQDTWLAVLEGLPSFAGRSSLKTWVVRILYNRARTRAVREVRSVPFSALGPEDPASPFGESFTADGAWRVAQQAWNDDATPERALADAQTRKVIDGIILQLPEQQRLVIELRDVAEVDSAEVCEMLGLSEANQRVLLHRARHKVRLALNDLLLR
jgi:RNA polymerase sigma-70 factor (ECF subfamily)